MDILSSFLPVVGRNVRGSGEIMGLLDMYFVHCLSSPLAVTRVIEVLQ
jgi:hypothetical protein